MSFGCTGAQIFVASITSIFSDSFASGRLYRSKLDQMLQYMRHSLDFASSQSPATLLNIAAVLTQMGHVDVLKLLLARGGSANDATNEGLTPRRDRRRQKGRARAWRAVFRESRSSPHVDAGRPQGPRAGESGPAEAALGGRKEKHCS